jgi:uncharacterized protein YfaS (alpha-2-macroglobulin family)
MRLGDTIRIAFTVVDNDTREYVDPDTITITIRDPDLVEVSDTYPGDVVRDSVGHYHLDFTIPGASSVGTWYARVVTVGAATASDVLAFVVSSQWEV